MIRIATIALLAAGLAGCETTGAPTITAEQLRAELGARCTSYGFTPNTPQWRQCGMNEGYAWMARRQAAREAQTAAAMGAIGDGLASVGQAYTAAATTYRPPMTCTTQQFGAILSTSCY